MTTTQTTTHTDTAWTFTLAGALLESLDHAGTVRGEVALQSVLRMDLQRVRVGIPSLARQGAHELL